MSELPEHLESVGAQCLNILDALEPHVMAAQEAYRDGGNWYCQLPLPHDAIPMDGDPTPCDWDRYFDHVRLSWAGSDISGLLPDRLPCSPCCDVWHGAAGPGYRISIYIRSSVTGRTYICYREYGPTGVVAGVDWREVPDDV